MFSRIPEGFNISNKQPGAIAIALAIAIAPGLFHITYPSTNKLLWSLFPAPPISTFIIRYKKQARIQPNYPLQKPNRTNHSPSSPPLRQRSIPFTISNLPSHISHLSY